MTKTRKLAHAAILAAGFLAVPLFAAACPANVNKPFNSGPLDSFGFFSQWVVDQNGVALQVCTDSVDGLGNPPPCFFDPVEPGNPLSEALGRGGEAFLYLADNVFTSDGTAPIDAVIVMGVETAFLSPEVTAGFQTQFQRLRTRINVSAVGFYKVETPWGNKTYRVDTLLRPGGGQSRMEISEPIDISFGPSSTVAGLVTPFLVADNRGSVDPTKYIGDGLTPTTVGGSPCGDNFIRVTATGLDGVTPIPISRTAPTNVFTNRLFTVQGKLAPVADVPLAITGSYYTRNGGNDVVTVLAEGSTSASQLANATVVINGVTADLTKQAHRFYGNVPMPAMVTLPAEVSITATDNGILSTPNTKTSALRDLVTISSAEARCSGTGSTKSCLMSVQASSSDDGSGADGAPVLTVQHNGAALTNGVVSFSTVALPGVVTVVSTKGGVATRPVTVINQ
ncbi:MAG: hypothetical protein RL722_664 [Pseudomonadota bacterium]|jgi:hypothetical protein